jgi:hypothetical protein
MNAHTPADLLADAFTCSGSVRHDSAPWKAQAIANLESRLAVRWAADRQREVFGDASKDPAVIEKSKRECRKAVYDAIAETDNYTELCAELGYPAPYIQSALRNLVSIGAVTYSRRGERRTYAQALEGTLERDCTASGTWMLPNIRSASAAKIASGKANRTKIAEMYGVGLSADYIAAMVGLSRRRVMEVIQDIKREAKQ